jgi:hypothetical protein
MAERAGVVVLKTSGGARERDLIEACEATFNIDLSAGEAESLRTVGDLYGLIRWKCQSDDHGPSGCAVAESYRQLRTHLAGRCQQRVIRPTSALEALLAPDPRADWTQLRRAFGKGMPRLELSEGQTLVVAMLVALGLAGGVFGGLIVSDATGAPGLGVLAGLGALGLTLAIVLAYSLAFARSIPRDLRTLADLARAVANQGNWSLRPMPRPAMWDALEDIIRRDAGFEGPVTADLAVELQKKAGGR